MGHGWYAKTTCWLLQPALVPCGPPSHTRLTHFIGCIGTTPSSRAELPETRATLGGWQALKGLLVVTGLPYEATIPKRLVSAHLLP